jgi:hypothetical protein
VKRELTEGATLGWHLAFCAGAVAAGWALVSPRFALSLALGALLESVNFDFLWRASQRILLGGGPGAGPALGAFALRFLLLGGALWAALRAGADPLGLVVGLSLMVPAIVIAAWRARPEPGPAAAPPPPDDPSWDEWNPWLARERELPEEADR